MPLTTQEVREQKSQAEELLFSGPQSLGFAKALFFGHFNAPLLFPYPELGAEESAEVARAEDEVRRFAETSIDAAAIDRDADIPPETIAGLARVGVLGMTAPKEFGGRAFSQLGYLRIMEILGGHCSSTAVFVNAHHSIGIRALLLFGTRAQQERWLPDLVAGTKLAAFALTEPEAGSDAANVRTTATPSPDGKGYLLNGEKYYITNGAVAHVLTVMARTPVADGTQSKVTAFLVTPDMPGFGVKQQRMDKVGIRGTATGWITFKDVFVPAENVLGQVGKGLRVALTVLDFGRTTFGASCTGAAKTCLRLACEHARTRVQFKQKLGEFELVKKKIAYMAAHAFAMEATTAECASFIDRGFDDFMLETAMLKVWSTDALWQIVNDTLQIYGGKGYFTDQPLERMMRDARINQIGEGANDVLRAFIAVVGMRGVGENLKGVLEALAHPFKDMGTLWKFGRSQVGTRLGLTTPEIPVRSAELKAEAHELAKRVREFGVAVQDTLANYRRIALKGRQPGETTDEETLIARELLRRQYPQERLADAACELYAASCTLSRLDALLMHGNGNAAEAARDVTAGRYFLKLSNRRVKRSLAELNDNDDEATNAAADAVLGRV